MSRTADLLLAKLLAPTLPRLVTMFWKPDATTRASASRPIGRAAWFSLDQPDPGQITRRRRKARARPAKANAAAISWRDDLRVQRLHLAGDCNHWLLSDYGVFAYVESTNNNQTGAFIGGASGSLEYRINPGTQDALSSFVADYGHSTTILPTTSFSRHWRSGAELDWIEQYCVLPERE
jgi:hypothetical protein